MRKNCLIFAGGCPENQLPLGVRTDNAYIIAADIGYENCIKLGLVPDLVIGDFDSLGYLPDARELMTFAPEKDDTDLMLAVREALKRGYDDISILGAYGGRFDHMFANVQTLAFITSHNARGRLISADECTQLLAPGEYRFERAEGFSLSLFAYSPAVKGLTLKGTEYTLQNGCLQNSFPLGVSNSIKDGSAEISFTDGLLLVVQSRL